MKKLTAIVLTLTMLFSLIGTIPTMAEETATVDFDSRKSVYLDITQITNAYTRQAYGYIEDDMYPFVKDESFKRTDSDPVFSMMMNTNYGTAMGALATYNGAMVNTNLAVMYHDITTGISSGALTLYNTEEITGTVGVKDEETELYSKQSATYDVSTYLYKTANGTYKLGPVAERNEGGDDFYAAPGSMIVIGGYDKDGDGYTSSYSSSNVNNSSIVNPYTMERATATETVDPNKLENVNQSADFVNILMYTFEFADGLDGVIIPVTVKYTSGDPTVKYVIENLYNVDPMKKVMAVPAKEDGTHTVAELDAYYKSKNDYYLTDTKMEELGLTGLTLDKATFGNADIFAPERGTIGKIRNRNASQTTTSSTDEETGETVYTSQVIAVNEAELDLVVSDISIPVDKSRVISSINIESYYSGAEYDNIEGLIKTEKANSYYVPVYFEDYKGTEYNFYMKMGRQCQRRNNLLAMSLVNKSHNEVIAEINAKIETATEIEALEAVNSEINAYVADNEGVTRANFDVATLEAKVKAIVNNEIATAATVEELEAIDVDSLETAFGLDLTEQKTAIANKIADINRIAGLNNRYETYNMNLFEDVFATDSDFSASDWYLKGSVDKTSILNMKGYAISASGQIYPDGDQDTAYKASQIATVSAIKEEDGKYTYTLNGVPFALGTISKTDGTMGANAWIPRSKYVPGDYTGAGIVNSLPAVYTPDGSNQVVTGTFTVGKSGISEANILATNVYPNQIATNKFIDVTVTYETGEPEHHYMVVGQAHDPFENTVYLIPWDKYEPIATNSALTNEMISRTTIDTLDKYKELVTKYVDADTAASVTEKPSNWYGSSNDTNEIIDIVYTGIKNDTKYQAILDANPVQLSSLSSAVDTSKFAVAKADSSARSVILPIEYDSFVPAVRRNTYTYPYNTTYVTNHKIPIDSSKTLESISIAGNLTDASYPIEESGGYSFRGLYNVLEGMIMLTYNGESTITINGTKYVPFMKLVRDCAESVVLGMTLTNSKTTLEEIAEVNEQLAAATTKEDAIAALSAKANLINSSNGTILAKDFDSDAVASAEAKLSEGVLAEIDAATTVEAVEAIDTEIDGYVTAYGIDATALKAATAARIVEINRVGSLNDRTYTYLDFNPNVDMFSSLETIRNYAMFATATNSSDAFNALYTGTVDDKTYTYRNRIDTTTREGIIKNITGEEDFYKKGLAQLNTNQLNGEAVINTPMMFVTDTYTAADLTTLKSYYWTNAAYAVTSKTIAESLAKEETTYKRTAASLGTASIGADNLPTVLEKTTPDAEGSYYVTLDDPDTVAQFKVGPINDTLRRPNAAYQGWSLNIPEGTKGDTLSLALLTDNVNTTTFTTGYTTKMHYINNGKTAFYGPKASLQMIDIKYKDDDTVYREYVITPAMSNVTNADHFGAVVVELDKYEADGTTEIKYDKDWFKSETATASAAELPMTLYTGGASLKLDDIKLPEGFHSNEMNVAIGLRARHDTKNNSYSNIATVANIDLKDAEIESVKMTVDINFADEGFGDGIIVLNHNGTEARAALIPVTFEGMAADKVYYAYVGSQANSAALLGATVSTMSAQERIDETESEMAKITALSSMEDAAYVEDLFNSILADGKVKESDFDAAILAAFKANLATIKEKANVSGTIELTYVEGEKPVASVTIKNLSALANKPYKVIIACYDEYENLLGTTVKDYVSSTDKEVTFTVTANSLPDGTKLVKGFIWKDFTTLIPLAAADEAAASSYALDNFFDVETGEFKQSEGELNIVFIGDSLTQGASTYDGDDSALNSSEKLHWTKVVSDYFAEQTGRTVNMYNAGVGGVQTSFLTKMISQTVEKTKADIIFIENVNDLNNGSKTNVSQQWTENLARNLAKLDKKPVVIMAHAVNPFKDKTLQDNHINAKDAVAQAYNLASVNYMQYYYDNTNGFDTTSDWMQEDYGADKIAAKNVHPLAAGYNRFGNYIVSQISANPSAYITRINPADDVAVMYEATADLKYTLTYPSSSRFTYDGFNLYTNANKQSGYTTADAEYIISWKYNFPHGGAAQAITTDGGASIEFTTDANAVEVVHSCPYLTNRRADFIIYVDGDEVVNNTTSNVYANVLNTTTVTLDGEGLHKVRVEVKQDSTAVKNVFNFAYLVEQK